MNTDWEKDVRTKVANLMALVAATDADPESYEFVLSKLTSMAIRGTAPPSCAPKEPALHADTVYTPWDDGVEFEDFAERKESFVAP